MTHVEGRQGLAVGVELVVVEFNELLCLAHGASAQGQKTMFTGRYGSSHRGLSEAEHILATSSKSRRRKHPLASCVRACEKGRW